ncbi:hypothetical protein EMCRGX_G011304 [Ephydatia muelleri]
MSTQPRRSVLARTLILKREVDSLLTEGTQFWRWEQGENQAPQKLQIFADKDAFFLYAKPDDKSKPNLLWDFSRISDVRSGLPSTDMKLHENLRVMKSTDIKDYFLTIVYRQDGITNVDYIGVMCEAPGVAARWKKAVNSLLLRNPHRNATMATFLSKHHTQILLSCNGYGQITVPSIHDAFLQHYHPESELSQVLSFYSILKTMDDGMPYVQDADFTAEMHKLILNQLTNIRDNVDSVLLNVGEKTVKKQQMTIHEFQGFISNNQRNPFLKDTVIRPITKDQAQAVVERHENKLIEGVVTAKAIFNYLLSEECNVLNTELLEQTMDMTHPLSHYFINSSHNTYLLGYQYNSWSSVEMYRQCLLLGCRCIELDCWPEGEDIVITHGNALCSKIRFEDVVEAINEYAFVTSDYPVILSIENHCKTAFLLQKMARIFIETFGNKLLTAPLENMRLEAGQPLPSPEMLKQKILLKCKVKRQRCTGDNTGDSSRFSPDYESGVQDTSVNEGQDVAKYQGGDEACIALLATNTSTETGVTTPPDDELTQVSLQPISSKEDGTSLIDLVNYCTGISFEGFESADRLNCSFYMSSFPDDKALSLLRASPVQLVKYNMRQLSRIYPQPARISSSNYMPQVFWNAGCQLAALNFQHSDVSACLNHTKFEYNGSTGYLLKPAVMLNDKDGEIFNPSAQAVLKNIVPVNLKIKVISGLFLTVKQVNCYSSVSVFGLQADTVANKFISEKKEAPNPRWEHEPFIFEQIILPEMATVHFAVYDEEKELLGQRFIPLCAIMAGYRYIPLRNHHNEPLPLAALFVHITVEDWIHSDLKDVADFLADPFAHGLCDMSDMEQKEGARLSPLSHPIFPDTLPIIEQVKSREKPVAVNYDDELVLHDQNLQRVLKRASTERKKLTDRQHKELKSLETRNKKSQTGSEIELESLHTAELCRFEKQTMQEEVEKHLASLKEVHRKQKKQIIRQHKLEVKCIGAEIISEIGLQSMTKSSTIDDRITQFGSRMRQKLEELQMQEISSLEMSQSLVQESLTYKYITQIQKMNKSGHTT